MEDEIDDKTTKAKKKKKRPRPFATTVQAQVITSSFTTTNTGEILGGRVTSTTTDNPEALVNRSINDIMQNAFEPGDLRIMSSGGTAREGRMIGEEMKSDNTSNKGEKSPLSTEHEDEIRNIEADILGGRKGSSSSSRGLSPPPPPDVSLPLENNSENKSKQWEKVKEEEQPQSIPMENNEKPAEVIMETTNSHSMDDMKTDKEDAIKKAPSEEDEIEEEQDENENEINRKDLVRFCVDLTILIQDGVAPELVYTVFNNLAMTFIAMEKYPDSLNVCDDAIEFAKVCSKLLTLLFSDLSFFLFCLLSIFFSSEIFGGH
jgi:hypothetical protein